MTCWWGQMGATALCGRLSASTTPAFASTSYAAHLTMSPLLALSPQVMRAGGCRAMHQKLYQAGQHALLWARRQRQLQGPP